mmetsp:Transcript_5628/g.6458  ORF Transcript_5628/g.6458 Transcript_5628/m.6458 type:complete len:88 (-) Transcript_5628:27-290(-)|eukprot:CAMPEP_0197855270 /NCGR_PEP_ID=MMETSP1438-20131217/26286_1 /TAXON_ID=1461541 /ORGANISM="Pterosperma sp., Strain CCMP1384" /LENGTH=87 /DNA_ID=CAMNT_0043470311 /DNA_START=1 /DNA_END=264 /DNA_ORIENTATION=-
MMQCNDDSDGGGGGNSDDGDDGDDDGASDPPITIPDQEAVNVQTPWLVNWPSAQPGRHQNVGPPVKSKLSNKQMRKGKNKKQRLNRY